MSTDWVSTKRRMPPNETPVLCVYNRQYRILSRELESDGYESTYSPFYYWDDPSNSSTEISDMEVTHWMHVCDLPNEQ